MRSAFFDLYESLPRQGPGDRATLDFALSIVGSGGTERILDAGCGTGADIEGLLNWAPDGHITALDMHAPFIEQVARRYAGNPRVHAEAADMSAAKGPFDLIWSAGALYFLGLKEGLQTLRQMLSPSGALIFSHPAYFSAKPSAAAAKFWEGEGEVLMSNEVIETTRIAGFSVWDASKLSDAAWEAYYTPLQKRIEALRYNAKGELASVLARAQVEVDTWRRVKSETGYIQIVALRQ